MDLGLGGALGSGWREAVAHDLEALTGKTFGINSVVVLLGVALVVGLIGAFGALVGGIFGVMLARLFSFLTKGDEA
jgi:predicted PurR-regulated permease PerM